MRLREICGLYFFRRAADGHYELMNFPGECDGPVAVFEFAEHPGYRNRAELPAVPGLAFRAGERTSRVRRAPIYSAVIKGKRWANFP
jgi:hypothetical protein